MSMNPRLLRPTASGFNPRQISGLALWLDAADSSALYTTSEGPVAPVSSPLDITGCVGWWDASDASTFTLDGSGNVEAWADKTSQGNDLTQATAANRPSVTAAAVNGLPAVTFDGSNDTLRTGAISLTQPFQYYLVFRFESAYTSGAPRIIDAGTQPSPGRAGEFFRQGADDARLFSGSTVVGSSVPAGQLEQFNLWSISSGGASDSFIRYKGGEYQVSTTAGTQDGSRITLGGDSNATASSHSNISVAELVLVSGALSAAERASLERYFAIKYGFANVHAPATAASDPVGYWGDKSGNGRHTSTTDATKRPLVHSGLYNGRRVVDFDGVNDTLATASYTAENARPGLTRFIVYHRDPGAAGAHSATVYNGGPYSVTANLASAIRTHAGISASADFGYTANNDVGSLGVWVAAYDGTAGNFADGLRLFFNGSIQPQVSTSGSFPSATPGAGGALSFYLGSNIGANGFLNGKVAEYLSYTRALTTSERRKVETYLARKWGITLAPQVSNADAQDWVNRVYGNGGTVSTSTANAVNTFCAAIDAAGIRDRFARLNLFCGSSLNAALVPLYKSFTFGGASLGNATDTNNGPFVSGDYVESVGLLKAGNTNSYLDTGLATDDLPTAATGHMAAWMGTHSPAAFLYAMGSDTATAQRYWLVSWTTGGSSVVRAQWGQNTNATSSGLGATIPAGLYIGTRTSSTELEVYGDGASLASAASSVTPTAISNNFYIAAANNDGVASGFATFPLAGYSIGESLTAGQAAAYNTIYKALISALGRPLT